jgi:hypothetical protein
MERRARLYIAGQPMLAGRALIARAVDHGFEPLMGCGEEEAADPTDRDAVEQVFDDKPPHGLTSNPEADYGKKRTNLRCRS